MYYKKFNYQYNQKIFEFYMGYKINSANAIAVHKSRGLIQLWLKRKMLHLSYQWHVADNTINRYDALICHDTTLTCW